jgi:transposase InsO family protein
MSWLTASEIAMMALPSLPATKRGVQMRARQDGWAKRIDLNGKPLFRRRKQRGGGVEYHYSVLPPPAVAALAKRGLVADISPILRQAQDEGDKGKGAQGEALRQAQGEALSSWNTFDALPTSKKKIAKARLATLKRIEALVRAGQSRTAAVTQVANDASVSPATIYNWIKCTRGLRADARLPALAPRQAGRIKTADCPDEALAILKSDWLRLSKPSFEACFDRLCLIADEKGWKLPAARTLWRRLQNQIPEAVQVLLRDGGEKLERMYPPMDRDRSHFHAMEWLNADGHRFDVFVTDKPGEKPYRPLLLAIQDLYSGKFVGWRYARSESADVVRLAFGDVFRKYGIPDTVLLDNGRAFASKWITGGTPNRFRFKVKAEDPVGVLSALGIQIRWARPYRGQSKPIERAFRDFCDRIAKHPAFEGAYTGNSTSTQPENYGSRAVPFEQFKAVVDAGIAQHNAKTGRRTRVCKGVDSFDQVFAKSYAAAPVRRAGEAQLRSFLLAAEKRYADKKTGAVELFGTRYWSAEIATLRGTHVVVRFDPDHLDVPVHVYRLDGAYVGKAPVMQAGKFDCVEDARTHERKRKAWLKAQKDLAAFEKQLQPREIAAMLPEIDELPDLPRPKVARLVAAGGQAITAVQLQQNEEFEASLEAGLAAMQGASKGRLTLVE